MRFWKIQISEKIGHKICHLRRKPRASGLYCKAMRCYLACRWHAIIACWVASFYFEVFNQPQSRWVTKRVNNLPRTNSYLNLDLYQHIGSNFRRLCTFYGKKIVFFSCWPSFFFNLVIYCSKLCCTCWHMIDFFLSGNICEMHRAARAWIHR